MTIGNSDRAFYGACLTRYVPLNDSSKLGPLEQVLQETEGLEVYIPAGLSIISRYPILDTLKQRLDSLHAAMHDDEAYLSDVNWLPSAAQMAELLSPFDFAAATATQGHVRACFREAMATLLRTVEEFRFVLSDDFDYVVVFDRIAFLRRLPSREQSFYRSFLETQVFSHEIASVDI
eukprot:jgi/Phyca11/508513/fgenesh2_kg.PHYCAscaffold_35_\